jgi:predicted  nucleic acid-binding Zn-ribbon protein
MKIIAITSPKVTDADEYIIKGLVKRGIDIVHFRKPDSGIEDVSKDSEVKSDIPENVDTRRYMDKMAHVRALRDTLSAYEESLAHLREKYALEDSKDQKKKLAEQILGAEADLPSIQSRLDVAVNELQKVEMDFLFVISEIHNENMFASLHNTYSVRSSER